MSELKEKNGNAKDARWSYVKLKDGRSIASPKSGGKFSKSEIRDAVRVAKGRKEYKSAG